MNTTIKYGSQNLFDYMAADNFILEVFPKNFLLQQKPYLRSNKTIIK